MQISQELFCLRPTVLRNSRKSKRQTRRPSGPAKPPRPNRARLSRRPELPGRALSQGRNGEPMRPPPQCAVALDWRHDYGSQLNLSHPPHLPQRAPRLRKALPFSHLVQPHHPLEAKAGTGRTRPHLPRVPRPLSNPHPTAARVCNLMADANAAGLTRKAVDPKSSARDDRTIKPLPYAPPATVARANRSTFLPVGSPHNKR